MSDRLLVATFAHEEDVLEATLEVRRLGYHIRDIYTPHAVHGLDRAMGLRPSRLTWVCFCCAMTGLLGMLWFEHWSASTNWAIDVGGKPWNALPSDAPVAFELAVLLAGFGSVFALFAVCRLYPGRKAVVPTPEVTNDAYVMVLEQTNAAFDVEVVSKHLEQFDVRQIEERVA